MSLHRILIWYISLLTLLLSLLAWTVGFDTGMKVFESGKMYSRVIVSVFSLRKNPPSSENVVFVLGDSTIATMEPNEALPAVLQRQLASCPETQDVEIVDWSFIGADSYHYYCLLDELAKYSPDLVIITVNWRVFSLQWINSIGTGREMIVFAPFVEEFSPGYESMREVRRMTLATRLRMQLDFWMLLYLQGSRIWARNHLLSALFGGRQYVSAEAMSDSLLEVVRDMTVEKGVFFIYYPDGIRDNNVQFRTFRALTDAAARRNFSTIYYFSPTRVDLMKEWGIYETAELRQDVDKLKRTVETKGSYFVDCSHLLSKERFLDRFGHYDEQGTVQIVDALLPTTRRILEDRPKRLR